MGLLRIILALSVLADHVGSPSQFFHFTGSQSAVEIFFVISGYLIARSLESNYSSIRRFYKNRCLRIYPMYFVVLIVALTWNFVNKGPLETNFLIFIVNLALIGLDILLFSIFKTHGNLQQNIIIGQSWSLALELYFYILAPIILRIRKVFLLILTFVICTTKFILLLFDVLVDPFSYRFFPLEIGFFLLGACAHYYVNIVSNTIAYGAIVLAMSWTWIGGGSDIQNDGASSMLLPLAITLALPSLAKLDENTLVHSIGSYAFPIYLTHLISNSILGGFLSYFQLSLSPSILYCLNISSTIAFSALLIKVVDDPISKLRSKNRK